ncbi:Phophatidylserine decarboxylase-domain-containing protein [Pisolithus orientalis]|uniref:Phophatidylserine decarboxylase-domain-containing protein n=1 Tax=Pisolithus orientalis TaxID=936130 RepID=UPI0022249FC8|nr:Phophatidylserine decarboxylase-domain-containing protein [Pisolithus orientalis]KAI5989206.1 Phophatidylserine decarboxylase-domain-containing protein [Pisolithus orientalis]
MSRTTVCRWLPKDPAAVETFVSDLLVRSRVIHGRHPKTRTRFAKAGESLKTAISRIDIKLDLNCLRSHYRVIADQVQVYTVRALHPIVQEFQDYIEREGVVYAAFNEMFEQAPPPQNEDQAKIEDYVDLMEMIDTNLTTAPSFGQGVSAMVAAVPYYGIISRFCNTPAGYNAFTHPGVNERFCRVFTAWHEYLTSSASTNVIHDGDGGWLSTAALNAMVQSAGGTPDQDTFDNFFICDTSDPHYGFKSYDELFVRELKAVHRAVVYPDNPAIINSACSSTVHQVYYNLKRTDRFWIKNTPYSLNHMLAEDDLVDTFAMLGSLDYHRWRSPVNGTVVKTRLISGATHPNPPPTYYAACLDDDHEDLDVVSRSQDFVSNISTRALIYIQAEEPVGLMCFVGVGLGEVSTCNVVVNEGQELKKGDELGQFHFGGSTHCLIFRPGVTVTPIDQDGQPLEGSKVRVGKDILIATKQP